MAIDVELPYREDAQEIQNAAEYSEVSPINTVEAFLVNHGTIPLELPFELYDTHVCMAYEYSECALLEPIESGEDLGGILIAENEEEEISVD